jgi:hypothetical protein
MAMSSAAALIPSSKSAIFHHDLSHPLDGALRLIILMLEAIGHVENGVRTIFID